MPATSTETLCEACQDLFSEERYDERNRIYLHHQTTAAFRQALDLPCAICIRIWINFSRRTYQKNIPFDAIDQEEFERFTPITYGMHPPAQTSSYPVIVLFTAQLQTCLFPQSIMGKRCRYLRQQAVQPAETVRKVQNGQRSTLYSSSTRSDASFQFLLGQMSRCRSNHSSCGIIEPTVDFMPTRLIELVDNEYTTVRLSKKFGRPERYAALSHRWGASQPMTLSRDTESELLRGIALDRLPKTFQDAVTVTRRFGLKHVWIDSLQAAPGGHNFYTV